MTFFMLLIVCFCYPLPGQQVEWDSLNIQYEIVQMEFRDDENIVKIRLPAYLPVDEVKRQVRLATYWPGSPPPQKKTLIYVFKDLDTAGTSSKTEAEYRPGRGFKWKLDAWQPDSTFLQVPTYLERLIYNAYLDTLFSQGLTPDNKRAHAAVAREFKIPLMKVDTIYYKVKYWLNRKEKGKPR